MSLFLDSPGGTVEDYRLAALQEELRVSETLMEERLVPVMGTHALRHETELLLKDRRTPESYEVWLRAHMLAGLDAAARSNSYLRLYGLLADAATYFGQPCPIVEPEPTPTARNLFALLKLNEALVLALMVERTREQYRNALQMRAHKAAETALHMLTTVVDTPLRYWNGVAHLLLAHSHHALGSPPPDTEKHAAAALAAIGSRAPELAALSRLYLGTDDGRLPRRGWWRLSPVPKRAHLSVEHLFRYNY